MTAKEILKALKAHRGDVYVNILNQNDDFWVRAVKSDMIDFFNYHFSYDKETGFEMDRDGYIGKSYKD